MDDYPLIQFKNTVKRLGDNSVLDGINLSIYRGEITSIIGKSGTGKSVLLKHIIGLIEPESGQVVFEGKPISRMNNSARKVFKQKISYMSLHPLK
jgi:phospholipid/cholesterol/gamma-HCH transport system ATP-binding protein